MLWFECFVNIKFMLSSQIFNKSSKILNKIHKSSQAMPAFVKLKVNARVRGLVVADHKLVMLLSSFMTNWVWTMRWPETACTRFLLWYWQSHLKHDFLDKILDISCRFYKNRVACKTEKITSHKLCKFKKF